MKVKELRFKMKEMKAAKDQEIEQLKEKVTKLEEENKKLQVALDQERQITSTIGKRIQNAVEPKNAEIQRLKEQLMATERTKTAMEQQLNELMKKLDETKK
jgi:uncharacterized coiled-coil DUF342 family protein